MEQLANRLITGVRETLSQQRNKTAHYRLNRTVFTGDRLV